MRILTICVSLYEIQKQEKLIYNGNKKDKNHRISFASRLGMTGNRPKEISWSDENVYFKILIGA